MITIILIVLLAWYTYKRNPWWAYIIVVLGMVFMIQFPLDGYHEPELVLQAELMPIVETKNVDNQQYIAISQEGICAYKRVNENSSEDGIIGTTKQGNTTVEIIHIGQGETPRMHKYVGKAKQGLFSFAFWATKTKYVFYVP